jgi:hypothetical protein
MAAIRVPSSVGLILPSLDMIRPKKGAKIRNVIIKWELNICGGDWPKF